MKRKTEKIDIVQQQYKLATGHTMSQEAVSLWVDWISRYTHHQVLTAASMLRGRCADEWTFVNFKRNIPADTGEQVIIKGKDQPRLCF